MSIRHIKTQNLAVFYPLRAYWANPEFLTGMASPASLSRVEGLLDLLSETPTGLSKTALEAIFKELTKGRLVALAKSLGSGITDNRKELAKIAKHIPTRILLGQNDRILRPVDLYSLPPEVSVHSFAKTGHMPHWENPRVVLNIFLTAVRGQDF